MYGLHKPSMPKLTKEEMAKEVSKTMNEKICFICEYGMSDDNDKCKKCLEEDEDAK